MTGKGIARTSGMDGYDLKELERTLAEDDATAELGVRLSAVGDRVFVRGNVASTQLREDVLARVARHCGGLAVVDELTCAEAELAQAPGPAEELR
jgi:hypothetical protein